MAGREVWAQRAYKSRKDRYNAAPIAKVAELVDALVLGASGVTRGSSSLPFRTIR